MSESQKALFKARDIELLRLKDLCRIDANSGKRFFFKQIRQLGGNEVDQVQLALSRMDRELRLFVGTRLDTDSTQTLEAVERILDEEFNGPQSLADSIRELYGHVYDIEQNPRECAHIFKTKFEAICTAYPTAPRPDRTEILKQIFVQHLPSDVKQTMQCFMTKGFGEDLFIAELERTRLSRKMNVSVCQNSVGTDNRPRTAVRNEVPVYSRNPPSHIYPKAQSSPYPCRYCNNGQRHYPKDCPRGPRPGACFECLDVNHRQGSDLCVGTDATRNNGASGPSSAQR